MRVLVVGGTGRTGRRVVRQAMEAGHETVSFGRSACPDTVPAGAIPFAGDVGDAGALREALTDCDALVTALSIPRATRSPFAALTGPPDLHSRSTALLIPLLHELDIRRWIKLSAHGVGSSASRAGWGFRALIAVSNLAPAFADHARADAALQATDLDWTIVRPPMLTDADPHAPLRADPQGTTWTWTSVRTGDVAAWIVAGLTDETTIGRTVTLLP